MAAGGAMSDRHFCTYFDHRYLARGLALQASLARVDEDLVKLPVIGNRYETLNSQVKRAERALDILSNSLQEASLLEMHGLTELIIQDEPRAPLAPVTPIKIYHALLSFMLALLLACGLAFVLDFFSVRMPGTVAATSGTRADHGQ